MVTNEEANVNDDLVADEWEQVDKRTAEMKAYAEAQPKGAAVKSHSDVFSKISYSEVERWLDQLVIDPPVLQIS